MTTSVSLAICRLFDAAQKQRLFDNIAAKGTGTDEVNESQAIPA